MFENDNSEKMILNNKARATKVNADGRVELVDSEVVVEHETKLIINHKLVARLICSPDDIELLSLGRMCTEGYIQSIDDIESIKIDKEAKYVEVILKENITLTNTVPLDLTSASKNMVYMKAEETRLEKLEKVKYTSDNIFKLANRFAQGSKVHRSTKGAHSAYVMYNGEIVYSSEDIGRHNALDKAIGYILKNRLDISGCILYTTGRVPTDMVYKAIKAKVPVLVTKAVPSLSAINLAKEYNLTLICKAWPDSYEIFA